MLKISWWLLNEIIIVEQNDDDANKTIKVTKNKNKITKIMRHQVSNFKK